MINMTKLNYMIDKLYPFRECGYDPDAVCIPMRECYDHEWTDLVPNMLRVCTVCGLLHGRRTQRETAREFLERVLSKPECPTCGREEE